MTKSEFRKHIIVSSLLTVVATVVIISFCIIMFDKYSKPSEENTSISSGTVADVYYASGKDVVIVEMSDGEQFQLVCPWLPKDLYNAIGYDLDQLAEILEGENVEYRKMDKLPWVVEIYIDDIASVTGSGTLAKMKGKMRRATSRCASFKMNGTA